MSLPRRFQHPTLAARLDVLTRVPRDVLTVLITFLSFSDLLNLNTVNTHLYSHLSTPIDPNSVKKQEEKKGMTVAQYQQKKEILEGDLAALLLDRWSTINVTLTFDQNIAQNEAAINEALNFLRNHHVSFPQLSTRIIKLQLYHLHHSSKKLPFLMMGRDQLILLSGHPVLVKQWLINNKSTVEEDLPIDTLGGKAAHYIALSGSMEAMTHYQQMKFKMNVRDGYNLTFAVLGAFSHRPAIMYFADTNDTTDFMLDGSPKALIDTWQGYANDFSTMENIGEDPLFFITEPDTYVERELDEQKLYPDRTHLLKNVTLYAHTGTLLNYQRRNYDVTLRDHDYEGVQHWAAQSGNPLKLLVIRDIFHLPLAVENQRRESLFHTAALTQSNPVLFLVCQKLGINPLYKDAAEQDFSDILLTEDLGEVGVDFSQFQKTPLSALADFITTTEKLPAHFEETWKTAEEKGLSAQISSILRLPNGRIDTLFKKPDTSFYIERIFLQCKDFSDLEKLFDTLSLQVAFFRSKRNIPNLDDFNYYVLKAKFICEKLLPILLRKAASLKEANDIAPAAVAARKQ